MINDLCLYKVLTEDEANSIIKVQIIACGYKNINHIDKIMLKITAPSYYNEGFVDFEKPCLALVNNISSLRDIGDLVLDIALAKFKLDKEILNKIKPSLKRNPVNEQLIFNSSFTELPINIEEFDKYTFELNCLFCSVMESLSHKIHMFEIASQNKFIPDEEIIKCS